MKEVVFYSPCIHKYTSLQRIWIQIYSKYQFGNDYWLTIPWVKIATISNTFEELYFQRFALLTGPIFKLENFRNLVYMFRYAVKDE